MARTSEHYMMADNDAEAIWFLGTLAAIKASGARTGGALAVVEFTHPAGFATPRHVHHAEDEAFYVLAGAMRGFCGDRPWRATPGSFVWLPRGIPHGYAVEGMSRCAPWRSRSPLASTASSPRWANRPGSAPSPRPMRRTLRSCWRWLPRTARRSWAARTVAPWHRGGAAHGAPLRCP